MRGMENANPLGKYLADNGLSCAAFARGIGANPSQISRIVSGERGPSVPLALAIAQGTKGTVSLSTWATQRRRPTSKPTRRRSRSRAA